MNEANKLKEAQMVGLFRELATPGAPSEEYSKLEKLIRARIAAGEAYQQEEDAEIEREAKRKGRALTAEEAEQEKEWFLRRFEEERFEEERKRREKEIWKNDKMTCRDCGGNINLNNGRCLKCNQKYFVTTKGSAIATAVFLALLVLYGLYNTYKWGAERSESRIESLEEEYEALIWSYGEFTKDAGFVVSSSKTGEIHRTCCDLIDRWGEETYLLYSNYEDAMDELSLKPCPICKPDENIYFTYE